MAENQDRTLNWARSLSQFNAPQAGTLVVLSSIKELGPKHKMW